MAFDTLIITVYCLIDDFLLADALTHPRSRRGRPPIMSDAEVLTLALVGQRLGNSERHLLAVIQTIDPTLFPHLLSQRAFNQRVRELQPVLARLLVALSVRIDRDTAPYELADVVGVPVVRTCRAGKNPRLAGLVSGGIAGSERTWIEGCGLLVATTASGAITGLVLGSARTEGRWLFDALCQWRFDAASAPWTVDDIPVRRKRTGPDKPIRGRELAGATPVSGQYLVDNGFTGEVWHDHWADLGATVVLDGGKTASTAAKTDHHGKRQWIELVNGHLKRHLHLAYPGARTIPGLVTRITAKCCMFNLGLLINRMLGRDALAIGTLIRI